MASSPLHILQIVTGLNVYGAERVAFTLAKGMVRQGCRSTVASVAAPVDPELGAELVDELTAAGVAHLPLSPQRGPRRWQLVSATAALRRQLSRRDFDLVHVHTDLPELIAALVARPGRLAGVRTIHNTTLWPGRPRVAAFVERRLAALVPVAISEASRDALRSLRAGAGLAPGGRIELIRNAAGLEPSSMLSRRDARHALGLDPDARVLAFVGRLASQKGVDVLAQAAASAGWPGHIRLEIFGEGPLRPTLEAAQADGAPVRLHGAIRDVSRYYRAFDGLLAPSRFEGAMPLSILDAVVAGIPVAATACPGVAGDPTTDGALLWIDSLSPEAICRAAGRLLDAPRTVQAARDLSAEAMCASYLQLYEACVRSARPVRRPRPLQLAQPAASDPLGGETAQPEVR